MSIQLKNVSYSYPDTPKQRVLNIKNWSVAAGDQVFVHGPSGSGKSTLLNLLSGILQANAGEVSVMSQRLDTMSSHKRDRFRADHVGYIFQQFNLIPYLNAIDNIKLAQTFANKYLATLPKTKIKFLLSSLHVTPSDWEKPVAKLSVGQQQRIAIVRAMINAPALIIADEPTSALDENNRSSFISELMTMVSEYNSTLIFVSHDMTLAKYFNRTDSLIEINTSGACL